MPRSKSKVESALLAKGFQKTETDHHYFIYFTADGKKTTARTKTSHSQKMKDIADNLLSQMAKQCYLTKTEFLNLVDCPRRRTKDRPLSKVSNFLTLGLFRAFLA